MKFYIAGPMRGYPEFNKPAFMRADKILSDLGHTVFNPVTLDEAHGISLDGLTGDMDELNLTNKELRDIITRDLAAVLECDAVYMLRGWERSEGAKAEHAVAVWWKREMFYEGEEIPVNTIC